jgi:hypothetical protein
MYKSKKEKPIVLEVDQIYQIDGKKYLVDETTFNKTYVWMLDEKGEPYGRRRIIGGLKSKEIIKL